MTATDTYEGNYKAALRRQADKLSTYGIGARQAPCDIAALDPIAQLLGVGLNREAIASRLNAYENVCYLLSHSSPENLRQSEHHSLQEYARIAVQLDELMQSFAAQLEYEEDRQNSRNWIEEHQYRPDYSGELIDIVAFIDQQLAQADSDAA